MDILQTNPSFQLSSLGLILCQSGLEIGSKTPAFQRKNARFSGCGIEMWMGRIARRNRILVGQLEGIKD